MWWHLPILRGINAPLPSHSSLASYLLPLANPTGSQRTKGSPAVMHLGLSGHKATWRMDPEVKEKIFQWLVALGWLVYSQEICWSLNLPVSQNVTLLANTVFIEIIKLKLGHYTLIQYDWCPYKKWQFGHRDRHSHVETHREKTVMRLEWCIYKPRNARRYQKVNKARETSPLEPSETMVLLTPWFGMSSPQSCEKVCFS